MALAQRRRHSPSDELRAELARAPAGRVCDRLAELSGLAHTAGRLHLRGRGEVSLHLDVAAPAIARRVFRLLKSFGVDAQIRTYERRALELGTRYEVHVEGSPRALQTLNEAGVVTANLGPLARPPKRVAARACCRRAYLRGALLGAGSVTGPRAAHLELRSTGREGAEFLVEVAKAEGIELRVHERATHVAVYAKSVEVIAGLLAAAGAHGLALGFEEHAVVGAAKARANRLANADNANLERTARAANAQVRALRRLRRKGGLRTAPPALSELAELRLEHPTLSLRELGLKCRPPASKSAVQHRLRALMRLAEP
jgi:cell division protein WhiA